jgi:micrococcal nuclease
MLKRLLPVLLFCFILSGCNDIENAKQTLDQISKWIDTIENIGSTVQNDFRQEETRERIPVELIKVVDGDTLKVRYRGREETVRLLLVDAAETNHPEKGAQPFGKEAKQYTSQMVTTANRLEIEFDRERRDQYKRLLAHVFIDGNNLNLLLLQNGHARYAYDYDSYKYEDEYLRAQQQAKQQKKNIWSVPGYVKEKGFDPKVFR